MREYVEHARSRASARPLISAAERKRRKEAVNYARSSVALEGFQPGKADEQHAQRFTNGEIGLADFVKVHHGSVREQ